MPDEPWIILTKQDRDVYQVDTYDSKNTALTDIKSITFIRTDFNKKKTVALLTKLYLDGKCSFKTKEGMRFTYYLGRASYSDFDHVHDHWGYDFEEEYRTKLWRW